MPARLPYIPSGTKIVDKTGEITTFFRLLWQQLIDFSQYAPTAAVATKPSPQTANIPTENAYVTTVEGWYRVSYYMRKTAADGVSSSLTMTLGWTDHGTALTQSFAALTLDTTGAFQSGSILVYCDAYSGITFAVAYASNTPGLMAYMSNVTVEQLV